MTAEVCKPYARRIFAAFPQFGTPEKEYVANIAGHLSVMAPDIRQLNRITVAVTETDFDRLPTIAEIREIAESLPGLELQALTNQPVSPDPECGWCSGSGVTTTWALWSDGQARRLDHRFQDRNAITREEIHGRCAACVHGFSQIDPAVDQYLCAAHARGALEVRLAMANSRDVVASFATWCDCDYGRYRRACDNARKRAEQDGGGPKQRRGGLERARTPYRDGGE